jgi:methanogenic corrinoid protein MtbC1
MSNAHDKLRDADTSSDVEWLVGGSNLNSEILLALFEAALSSDRDACRTAITEASKSGISNIDIAELYSPSVARHMGELWCSDHLSFASVTIGSARLQSLLRDLGPEWSADTIAQPNAPAILLATPRNAVHTLGAVVLAGQLRRRGYSVRLAFNADRHAIADVMDRIAFNAVFMSAAQSESLEKLRRTIEFMRTLSHRHLPVVIGGSIIEISTDIAAVTGADIVTSNIDEAIEFCGLKNIATKSVVETTQ